MLERELLQASTEVMLQYFEHFKGDAYEFIDELNLAILAWELYSELAVKHEADHEELVWSSTYFLNSINATLISTRLFLSGYIVASGNQARHAI
jgi:hypothetical protein